jgi:hypothetical protein
VFGRRYKLADPNAPSNWSSSGLWRSWEAPLNVVRGESHRQEALHAMCGSPRAQGYLVPVETNLRREPTNPVDKNAIRVEVRGEHVGYVAREIAAQMSPALDKAKCREFAVAGIIRGGSPHAPSFGLHLWLGRRLSPGPQIQFDDSFYHHGDFVIAWPPREGEGDDSPRPSSSRPSRPSGEVRTGASSHTGKWGEIDQNNPIATLKSSRDFLETETNPIERHFAFNVLEEALYKCRGLISGALEDFEAVCEQHHSEMKSIRPALMTFFEGIPMLPLYRQMAIMKVKAKDYQAAVDWCLRGLEVYGNDALRQDGVQDLRQRLAKLNHKLS